MVEFSSESLREYFIFGILNSRAVVIKVSDIAELLRSVVGRSQQDGEHDLDLVCAGPPKNRAIS